MLIVVPCDIFEMVPTNPQDVLVTLPPTKFIKGEGPSHQYTLACVSVPDPGGIIAVGISSNEAYTVTVYVGRGVTVGGKVTVGVGVGVLVGVGVGVSVGVHGPMSKIDKLALGNTSHAHKYIAFPGAILGVCLDMLLQSV
jgi:hypothetical protein